MFQTQTALLDFKKLPYGDKLKKVKEALELVKDKSSQFQDLYALCNLTPEPMESILDMTYETLMQTVHTSQEKIYQESVLVMKENQKKLQEQHQKEKEESMWAEALLWDI